MLQQSKSIVLNRIGRRNRDLPSDTWQLGSINVYKVKQTSNKLTNANVAHNLNETRNKIINCMGNPPYPNHTYSIADIDVTHKYIKVNTPCNNRVK